MNSITNVPALKNYYKYITFNPVLIISLIVILILYFVFFGSLGSYSAEENFESDNSLLKILGILMAAIFVVLVLTNGFMYFLNIDIVTSIKNFFTKDPEIDIIVDSGDELPDNSGNIPTGMVDQVYHIPGNIYTYEDAEAVCKAYGNRLATYKEIENSYESGGDWCSYGWSEGQMALFPTQYDKWENLQKIKGHENDCGRPGINGGYIDNQNVRFGANCYGPKPKITQQEAELMKNTALYPLSANEKEFDNRVQYWQTKIKDILISPFNHDSWSRF